MIDSIKEKLIKSQEIKDKTFDEMAGRIIESRFPSVFTNLMSRDFAQGKKKFAPDIERNLNGMVIYENGELYYNLASIIRDPSNPIDALSNTKELYALGLKGTILKLGTKNPRLKSGKILNTSSKLIVGIISDIVVSINRDKFIYSTDKMQLALIIIDWYLTGLIGLENKRAKLLSVSIMKEIFEIDFEKSIIDDFEFISLDLPDMVEMINATFETELSERKIHSSFLKLFNFAYLGLYDNEDLVAGLFALIKSGAYGGKYLIKRYPDVSKEFASAVEFNLK